MGDFQRRALITGITGQDGSYLAELLLAKGYEVHGIIRRHAVFATGNIDHIWDRLRLHHGDMLDSASIRRLLTVIKPDEIYNLAAQSHVQVSFEQPCYTTDTVSRGTLNLLEAVRDYQDVSETQPRIYQASSSEMFGDSPAPQDEQTVFNPRSPYACAKVHAYHLCRMYRDAYGVWVANGILFNHESPRRGRTFVTRKITEAVARIFHGLQTDVRLGNLEARRDWGYAGDFVVAMWLMLQSDKPDDYVVATGRMWSVKEWAVTAFTQVGLDWRDYVRHDDFYERPLDVPELCGKIDKARQRLGWEPKVTAEELCRMMVDADLKSVAQKT